MKQIAVALAASVVLTGCAAESRHQASEASLYHLAARAHTPPISCLLEHTANLHGVNIAEFGPSSPLPKNSQPTDPARAALAEDLGSLLIRWPDGTAVLADAFPTPRVAATALAEMQRSPVPDYTDVRDGTSVISGSAFVRFTNPPTPSERKLLAACVQEVVR